MKNDLEFVERSSGWWVVDSLGIVDGPWATYEEIPYHWKKQIEKGPIA